ncbi:nucleotide exchange factor GrpE [Chloroflexota bacterium]
MIQQVPEEEQTTKLASEIAKKENIKTLKRSLAEEQEKAENYLTNWQRAQADLVNYKRRSEQEKEEIKKFANSALMVDLLSALDDLDRAFTSIPPRLIKHGWVDGINLVKRKLQASLNTQGLSPIEAVGEPFDPHLHEAIREDQGKEGIVIEEVQKGYMFHDRILRPSRVVVGRGRADETKTPDR